MEHKSLLAPLNLADFEDVDGFRNLSPFEMLLKATELDSQILEQERARNTVATISKQEEKASKEIKLFDHELINSSDQTETHMDDVVLSLAEKADSKGKSVIFDGQEDDQSLRTEKSGSKGKSVIFDGQEDDQSLRTEKQSGSTCKYETLLGDVDEEWVYKMEKSSKKQKKNYSKGSCSGTKITQNPGPAELPERFKNRISEIGGTEATLIIQKSLSETDVKEDQGRLLMPPGQLRIPDFLQNTELQELQREGSIKLPMIGPSLQIENIVLAKWNMRRPQYVLRTYWNQVVKVHELKIDDVVQVWSFRVQGQLHLALVKVI